MLPLTFADKMKIVLYGAFTFGMGTWGIIWKEDQQQNLLFEANLIIIYIMRISHQLMNRVHYNAIIMYIGNLLFHLEWPAKA